MLSPKPAVLVGFLLSVSCRAYASPQELGDVKWLRDFDVALAQSKTSQKPVLILFDEVPGCGTCVRYGQAVLSHPLLVEAAETLFVPVAVYNNKGGKDRAVLTSFNEPTWNNPVVRIVDHNRRPLSGRLAGDYSKGGLAKAMVASLKKAGRSVPEYLELLAAQTIAERRGIKRARFSMYCFWSGEVCLASHEGVVRSRTGFFKGREVVEVEYDPAHTSYAALLSHAKQRGCADGVFAMSNEEDKIARGIFGDATVRASGAMRGSSKDDKYQLRHTAWRFVPMTELQRSRANTLIGKRKDPAGLFSARQRALYQKIVAHPGAGWRELLIVDDLKTAFKDAESTARGLDG